jgi:hypothetical protein
MKNDQKRGENIGRETKTTHEFDQRQANYGKRKKRQHPVLPREHPNQRQGRITVRVDDGGRRMDIEETEKHHSDAEAESAGDGCRLECEWT